MLIILYLSWDIEIKEYHKFPREMNAYHLFRVLCDCSVNSESKKAFDS